MPRSESPSVGIISTVSRVVMDRHVSEEVRSVLQAIKG